MKNTYRYRLLTRIVLETTTPLVIGSGNKNIKTDAVVAKDVNGLPYIPGTTLAGLIRHSLPTDVQNIWFGFQEKEKGEGSRLIFTEAKLLSVSGEPIDGLNVQVDAITQLCRDLPIRQHVRINHKGTAVKNGKFDEEIVPKGARFCFEMELMTEDESHEVINMVLTTIQSENFRIGSGSRSGFGKISVISIYQRELDLCVPADLNLYLDKTSSLATIWEGFEPISVAEHVSTDYITYDLNLYPIDFLFFGSGFGDEYSDMNFVSEPVIKWSNEKACVLERDRVILIPASSVKGALAHRTAYHYNKIKKVFADKDDKLEQKVGKENAAVKVLFGSEGNDKDEDKLRGNILFSDIIIEVEKNLEKKVLNHVRIDRFTGGAVTGALFSEEILYARGQAFNLKLLLNKTAVDNEEIIEAFETALIDLCKGNLPLGGGVNRGNGTFTGSITKNERIIYE